MRTEYAGVNGSEKIPLFVDSSPGWNDYQDIGNTSIKPLSTDISAGMQEYIFGRNVGTNEFGIGAGMVADGNSVLLTGAGSKKKKKTLVPKKKVAAKKPVPKKKVSAKKPTSMKSTTVPKKKVSAKKPTSMKSTTVPKKKVSAKKKTCSSKK